MGFSNILALLGGVALFLFGMSLMGDGLKRVAGNRMELVLYRLTGTPLRGALLGYTKGFMNEMYDRIIEFAELQDFQDRQFKQLSSGMKSRLAFSIACLVNPEILILDEVLAVGDGAFGRKSENKMKEIIPYAAKREIKILFNKGKK